MTSSSLPSISVVVPSLDQGRFIERTLRSILSQGYPRLQVIVVDGGSTDETLSLLRRFSGEFPEVLRFTSGPDRGQAHAVNRGLEGADGEIIGWLNSDDVYAPGALHHAAREFDARPSVDIVYGRARFIDPRDRVLGPYPTRPEFCWESLAEECYVCQPATFFRRRVLDAGFRLDESIDTCMDYDFWIRTGRVFRVVYLDRHLADSRVHPGAKSVVQRDTLLREVVGVTRRHYGHVPVHWILAQAHDRHDRVRPGEPAATPGWRTYLAAALLCVRHNALAVKAWPRLLREIARRAIRKWARRSAPGPLRIPIGERHRSETD